MYVHQIRDGANAGFMVIAAADRVEWEEQNASLIATFGGNAIVAPSMREAPIEYAAWICSIDTERTPERAEIAIGAKIARKMR